MPDVTLSDGRDLVIDLGKITISEFRALLDPAQAEHEGDKLIGRCVGLSAEKVGALSYPDYRLLTREFFRKAREPLADPNSQSAAT
ncbi:MAG: hypothetical protein MUO37_12935 [Methyloceanibacter sp.]|nr:hypothetical protein [Methyloceanibacter sp.]